MKELEQLIDTAKQMGLNFEKKPITKPLTYTKLAQINQYSKISLRNKLNRDMLKSDYKLHKKMKGQIKRLATHAGSWYPKDSSKLQSMIDKFIQNAKNELSTKPNQNKGKIAAIIGPHAGYKYSGQVAAYAYCQLNRNDYNRIILLGPSHKTRLDSCALSMAGTYQTPIGDLTVDQEFNKQIQEESGKKFKLMPIEVDEEEHSLEMHLPYIKNMIGDQINRIKLVPIMVGGLNKGKQEFYGKILAKYLKDEKNLFIVSSDFCHWGEDFDYQYLREKMNDTDNTISNQIKKLDEEGIKHICNHDNEGFSEYLEKTENTICGRHAIGVLLEGLKECGSLKMKSELVKYGQSTVIIRDFNDSSVSYASITTKKEI